MKGLLYFGRTCLQGQDLTAAARAFEAFLKAYPESDLAVDRPAGDWRRSNC